MANVYGEKAAATFEWVRYSSLTIIIIEELLGEQQDFKRVVSKEKNVMMGGKITSSPSCKKKRHHGN